MDRIISARFNNETFCFGKEGEDKYYFSSKMGPYEYLLGALSGCFYYTILDKATTPFWDEAEFVVRGKKREEGIQTLFFTQIKIRIKNVKDKKMFEDCLDYAKENCSIYNTISQVSKMEVLVEYE